MGPGLPCTCATTKPKGVLSPHSWESNASSVQPCTWAETLLEVLGVTGTLLFPLHLTLAHELFSQAQVLLRVPTTDQAENGSAVGNFMQDT